jgi:TonB family protein
VAFLSLPGVRIAFKAMRKPQRVLGTFVVGALVACSTSQPASRSNPSNGGKSSETALIGTDPSSVCEKIQPPELVHRVPIRYPSELQRLGVKGTVVVTATVTAEGVPEDLKVSSSPTQRLSDLTIEAVRQWRYNPARCEGKPIRVYVTVTATFSLG